MEIKGGRKDFVWGEFLQADFNITLNQTGPIHDRLCRSLRKDLDQESAAHRCQRNAEGVGFIQKPIKQSVCLDRITSAMLLNQREKLTLLQALYTQNIKV